MIISMLETPLYWNHPNSLRQSALIYSTTKFIFKTQNECGTVLDIARYVLIARYSRVSEPTRVCVRWWRHQMETFSALLAICAGNSPGNSLHKGQRRGALMFSLICVWINDWVNNREVGDLRRYRAHYDFIVMRSSGCIEIWLVYRQRYEKFAKIYHTDCKTLNNDLTPLRLNVMLQYRVLCDAERGQQNGILLTSLSWLNPIKNIYDVTILPRHANRRQTVYISITNIKWTQNN